MATTQKDLRDIEKAVVKLRNKLKRVDMNYTVQISISSTDPTKVVYAAQTTPPADSLAPLTFVADNAADLIQKIKTTTKAVDFKAVDKAYHEAQIQACERTILGHEEYIKGLEEEDSEQNTEETNDTDAGTEE